MAWTSERVEILRELWAKGQSASQIAHKLGGVTRNAVIGKVHRLGLSNRASDNVKETKVGSKPAAKKLAASQSKTKNKIKKLKATSETEKKEPHVSLKKKNLTDSTTRQNRSIIYSANQPLPPQPSTSEISEETLKTVRSLEKKAKKLSLMELTERTCKWPIGDPATEKFWFCGHSAEPGKPYCETHIEIAFQPMTARRERRAR